MKRSETISQIACIISNYLEDSVYNQYELANIILEELEDLGMNPPRYCALVKDGSKFIKDLNEGDAVFRSGWEPEKAI